MCRLPRMAGKRKTSCTGVKSLILKFPTAVICQRYARLPRLLQVAVGALALRRQAPGRVY